MTQEHEVLAVLRDHSGVPAPVGDIIVDYVRPAGIYLLGGIADSAEGDIVTVSDVCAWSPENTTFLELPPLPGLTAPAVGLADGLLFRMGGALGPSEGGPAQDSAAMLVLSPLEGDSSGWLPLPRMNVRREEGRGAVLAGRLYVFGGRNVYERRGAPRAEYLTAEGWKPDAEFGSKLPSLSEDTYEPHAMTVDPKTDRVFLVAERRALIWHAKERKWDEKSLPAPNTNPSLKYHRTTSDLVFFDGSLYLFGTSGGDLWCLELKRTDKAWERKAQGPWLETAVCVPYKGRIYAFGGSTSEKCLSECHAYDPASDSWSRLPVSLPKGGRCGIAAVSLEQTGPLDPETRAFLTSLVRGSSN